MRTRHRLWDKVSASAPTVESQEVEDFLLHLEKERDVSPNTLGAYRRDLTEFVSYLAS